MELLWWEFLSSYSICENVGKLSVSILCSLFLCDPFDEKVDWTIH